MSLCAILDNHLAWSGLGLRKLLEDELFGAAVLLDDDSARGTLVWLVVV
jgi:hypothetical protein